MKTLSTNLRNHLAGELATLAELVKITRADGTVLGFTSHDRDLVVDGVTYKADSAFTPSAIESRTGLSTDNMDITGMLSDTSIAEADIRAGLYDHARVDVFICNWADITQGAMQLRRGWLGELTLKGGQYQAELRGLHDLLQRTVGAVFTPECRHRLGDSACGVNVAAITVTGTVTSVTDRQLFRDVARSEAVSYFSGGLLTWTSGANTGQKVEVKDFSGGNFTLWLPMPYAIQTGNTFSVQPGCDKRFATCRAKFNNLINFGGFPYLPGVDRILNYPDART